MSDDELLTIEEVARRLKVHPDTVRRWQVKGVFKAVRVGPGKRARVRILASDAAALERRDP